MDIHQRQHTPQHQSFSILGGLLLESHGKKGPSERQDTVSRDQQDDNNCKGRKDCGKPAANDYPIEASIMYIIHHLQQLMHMSFLDFHCVTNQTLDALRLVGGCK